MTPFLARIDFNDPTIWAILIGWVMSVTLHEFAHGVVAYWGGDYTIRERGGLTLNPIQYVDPLMSIVLPIVFLLMGGIPLPGGATYVRRDLLKNRGWDAAVSAAGPLMNLILFGLLAIPLLPQFNWINPKLSPLQWEPTQKFVAAMCYLQLLSVILNLVPIPPLDGFGIIGPFMNQETRLRLMLPPTGTMLFFGYFLVLQTRGFALIMQQIMVAVMGPELFETSRDGFLAIFAAR